MKQKSEPPEELASTKRAKSHRQRLIESGGKRVVIDLSEDGHKALRKLLAARFSDTQKDAVIRAVIEAAERLPKSH